MTDGPRSPESGRPPASIAAPDSPPRLQRLIVTAAFVAVMAILAVELSHADRQPLNAWLSAAALLLAGAGARIGVGRLRLVWLTAPLLAGIAWLSAGLATSGSAYDLILATIAVVPTVAIGVALGSVACRLLARRSWGRRAIRPLVVLAFSIATVPYPLAVIERQRTVAVAHPAGRLIDDRAGAFRGVGLGATAAAVERVFGRAPPFRDGPSVAAISPLIGSDLFDGPSALDYGPPPVDTFLRYAHVAFQVRRGRVRWIQINDHDVATSRGVGPGDSMSLVRRAYPQARCAEDSIHAEPDYIYYPECELRLGPNRWLTFFGTYRKPGVPVLAVWLSTQRLEGPAALLPG